MKLRLGAARRKAMMCQELVEVITDYLEGTLPSSDRARFEAHLSDCEHCTRYVEQFRLTVQQTGRLRTDHFSEELAGQLLEAFRGWKG
ncbi:MAG: zf-HC2 domain-containing protein [Actinomycetota bacterium]